MARQSSYRRYSHDDDLSSSTHMLWLVVVVIFLATGSFLFGRYFLGERLRKDASPVRNIARGGPSFPSMMGGGPAAPDTAPEVTVTAEEVKPPVETAEAQETETNREVERVLEAEEVHPVVSSPEPAHTAASLEAVHDEIAAHLQEARERIEVPPAVARERDEAELREAAQKETRKRAEERRRQAEQERRRQAEQERRRQAKPARVREKPKRQEVRRTSPPVPTFPGSVEVVTLSSSQKDSSAPSKPKKQATQEPREPQVSGGEAPLSGNGKLYRLQTGSFTARENADRQAEELRAQGFDTWVRTVQRKGRTVYEVQAGAFRDKQRAEKERRRLQEKGHEAFVNAE